MYKQYPSVVADVTVDYMTFTREVLTETGYNCCGMHAWCI